MSEPVPQRVVAIVGRPNVGKSALFNRLAGRRIAIVHEEPGVTRDRLECRAEWAGRRFELTDTGGLSTMDASAAKDLFEAETQRQAELAIREAAALILVVDITAGVLPLDREVARRLHASGRRTVIAANKADHPGLDDQVSEFESLGFPVFPVSALHNRGLDALMAPILAALPPPADIAEEPPLKVAIVGRPNVGKSSYINKLLGSDRVIVSDVPGTTRDSIDVPFSVGAGESARRYLLIDTAGARKLGRAHTAVERFSLFRAQKSIERADVAVLMLDAVEGPGEQDKKLAAQILEHRKGCLLLVNKWDLARGVKEDEYEAALRRVLPFLDFAPILFVSSLTGYSLRRSIEAIDRVAEQTRRKLTTGLLNRVLHDAVARVQAPHIRGRRMKYYYATQTETAPVTIRLFVNDPKRMTPAYRAYLVRELRNAFGLEGAPIVLQLKASHTGDHP
ncbi:MAG TPA: ribosome biogenesis GTPase Der [Kiritimatiellia bacterium]|nr:ribosome biogenesis GTPase Der [Kiritimatiellia bacterium]HRZ11399.1 ribosome biogenesis GTPase Der [Kiritimatiellia bacterium]HSA17050.1 ribosome biogenesis GTPase Der [Kiritimatiellia bacterium]